MTSDVVPRHWRRPLKVALLSIIAFLVMVPGFIFGPGQDQSVFLTLGQGLLDGRQPYVDLWDHKPPMIYVIAALASALPGDPWGMLVLLSIAAVTATACAVWTLTYWKIAVLAAVLLASYPATQGGGMTETFAVAFGSWALVLAFRNKPMWAGLLAALAVMTSLQLVALLPALMIVDRRWLPGAAGFALGLVPFGLWIDLPAFFDAVIVYSRAYLALDRTGDTIANVPAAFLMLVSMLLWIPLARPRWSRIEWAAVTWLAVGLILIAVNGRMFAHYATPLVVPAALLAAPALRRSWWARKYLWPVATVLPFVWGVLIAPWPY